MTDTPDSEAVYVRDGAAFKRAVEGNKSLQVCPSAVGDGYAGRGGEAGRQLGQNQRASCWSWGEVGQGRAG